MAFQIACWTAMSVLGLASNSDLCIDIKSGSPIESYTIRAVAQLGSALVWGTRGRGFKSRQPDKSLGSREK